MKTFKVNGKEVKVATMEKDEAEVKRFLEAHDQNFDPLLRQKCIALVGATLEGAGLTLPQRLVVLNTLATQFAVEMVAGNEWRD